MILESAEDIRNSRQPGKKAVANPVMEQKPIEIDNQTGQTSAVAMGSRGYIKRFIPYYIYKPPFGYPRRDIDLINVRKLAKSPFVYSVTKTLLDEMISLDWDIVPCEEVHEESVKGKIKNIKQFLFNPNDNNESFRDLLRAVGRDVLELDAGVIEKVYNRAGYLTQLFSVDGATILMNPDVHGYLGDRVDYVMPIVGDGLRQEQINHYYTSVLKEEAAYFQYNWTGGIWPVPFGKKELVYIKANNNSDSIYGTSPIMILYNILLILLYGSQVNLDMYVSNDLPNGILQLANANKDQINATRDYFNQKIIQKDTYGNDRKKFFNIPITSTTGEIKYINFGFNAKDMQMLEQQKWYRQLVYQVFGVTPDEMGETVDSNRSTSNEMSRIFKRKALRPLLKLFEYNITTNIVWELDPAKEVEFRFDNYDIEAEYRKAELNEKLLNTWTVNEIRQKDNMEALEGEEYDKIKGETQNSFNSGFDFGSPSSNDTEQDKNNNQSNKEDMQNEERSPEKEDKSNPSVKSISKVPKKTNYEKKLDEMYSALEKSVLGALE
ncbi:MAG: phage portal protein [Bacteroidia bacterium]|nr:phage portal protein [Bacteroidia bacterium]